MSNIIVNSVNALTEILGDNYINDTNIVCIDIEKGYIGVHTATPIYPVDVKGTIKCENLTVNEYDFKKKTLNQ